MRQREVLKQVLTALRRVGAEYALTGSYASTYWGVPRSTHDIDILARMDADQLVALAALLGEDYYADAEAMVQALSDTRHCNIIHLDSGVKVDVWLAQESGYDETRLTRRVAPEPAHAEVFVLSAEDVILSKLLWMQQGAGERHRHDILGILRTQDSALDLDYLRSMGADLGVAEALVALLQQSR